MAYPRSALSHLLLDGKIFEAERCRLKIESVKGETIDEWYSGKTADFGGKVQARRRLVNAGVFGVLPGAG